MKFATLLIIFLMLVSCGLTDPKYIEYPDQTINLLSPTCPEAQSYWQQNIRQAVQTQCIGCHQVNPKLVFLADKSSRAITQNRKALLASRGWAFATTNAHQGKKEFEELIPTERSYRIFVAVEGTCD